MFRRIVIVLAVGTLVAACGGSVTTDEADACEVAPPAAPCVGGELLSTSAADACTVRAWACSGGRSIAVVERDGCTLQLDAPLSTNDVARMAELCRAQQ